MINSCSLLSHLIQIPSTPHTQAEECFKETIAIDPHHLEGLMLYGIVCAMEERNDVAETFFEAATCVSSNSTLAWTLLGMSYLLVVKWSGELNLCLFGSYHR